MAQFSKKTSRKGGQVLITSVIFFIIISIIIVTGITSPLIRQISLVNGILLSKQSYFTAEAGSEDAYYRVKKAVAITFPLTVALQNATSTITLDTIGSSEEEITSEGNASGYIRRVVKDLTVTDGFSFNFGVQVGPGGVDLQNGSSILGNLYSGGAITGDGNYVRGDVVSSGATGSVSGIHSTSSVYAHAISNSTVDKDAYYQTIVSTTVSGTSHPGSTDQPTVPMPIADSLIQKWQDDATAGGVITSPCPYNITANVTIGPKEIDCDVVINGPDVSLAGSVWVKGNLTIKKSGTIVRVADSVGNKSAALIVDDPANRNTKGLVSLENATSYFGSTGNADSYVMIISRNTSKENGGSNVAIDVQNGGAGALLVYAPHGEIVIANNVLLKEVTSYKLTLKNNAIVIYSSGLIQSLFASGPGGSWKISKWKESF